MNFLARRLAVNDENNIFNVQPGVEAYCFMMENLLADSTVTWIHLKTLQEVYVSPDCTLNLGMLSENNSISCIVPT